MNNTDHEIIETITAPISASNREQWEKIIRESGHFFSVSAVNFFSCRVAWSSLTETPRAWLFITSEQDRNPYGLAAWDGRRRYSLRAWRESFGVQEVSEFGEYATLAEATRALRAIARQD